MNVIKKCKFEFKKKLIKLKIKQVITVEMDV
jgi:hypothetical protein